MSKKTKQALIEKILNPGVVAILRANQSDALPDACEALQAGGVRAIELTMTTPNALELLTSMCGRWGDSITFGMGSVLTVQTAELAVNAGAQFIVTPVLKPEVIAFCNQSGIPICAGSYTPTEAQTAYELGADFIKIFPADGLGPKYIRSILGPLPHLRIIPTGGVDASTAGDFIKAGCVAVAAGSTLVSSGILEARDWPKLQSLASSFLDAVAKARNSAV